MVFLKEQFDKAGLNIWNNSWYDIFDFSKKNNEKNYSFLEKNTDFFDFTSEKPLKTIKNHVF